MSSSRRRPPVASVLVLVVGAAVVSRLLLPPRVVVVVDDERRRRRRLLYSGGNPMYWDAQRERYANLQSSRDIDPSVEARARDRAFAGDGGDDGRGGEGEGPCSRVFLYLPEFFADHGHGSQVQLYVMSSTISTYMDRAMIVLDPPLLSGIDDDVLDSDDTGGSQFGCPIDAIRGDSRMRSAAVPGAATSSSSSSPRRRDMREDFPTGFSRLIHHPAWLSRGCDVPCAGTYDYVDWRRMATSQPATYGTGDDLLEVRCANPDGTIANVVVAGGATIRKYNRANADVMIRDRPSPRSYRWATNLGATPVEANRFSNVYDDRRAWDYLLGLMNRAGMLRFQPWIARDVERLLLSFDLPYRDVEYDAIHVRRGDKLAVEARAEVERYWRENGHDDMDRLPTDYVPFAHYLAGWDGPETCPTDDGGRPTIVRHHVYVATDDPAVVRGEIEALPNRVGPNVVLWNGCHELTFYFNPTNADAYHLNGDGEGGFRSQREDTCLARYHRNIVSIADMFLLCRARTFIGEYNSNWGRVIRTMRVRLNPTGGGGDDASAPGGPLTYTLDTRIAWGSDRERSPGS
ncbi:hypothetical protein ACHAW5_004309 [Stephanodiscus triporus]|uniref:Uncharacterized protein n=1 Tax=Stephanodiscus triporus TaxID=2934178 RepID=A0ABD3QH27_9STRA